MTRDEHRQKAEQLVAPLDRNGVLELDLPVIALAQVHATLALTADVETSPAGRDPEPAPEVPAVATTGQPGDQPTDERAEQIAGLRQLADWLEANPEVPAPNGTEINVYPSNFAHICELTQPAREQAALAELSRIGDVAGAPAVLDDTPAGTHPHVSKRFAGAVEYRALVVTEAYRRGYKPADTDIPRGGEEVAGPVEGAGPATTPAAEDDDDPADPGFLMPAPGCGHPMPQGEDCCVSTAAAPEQNWWFTFGAGQPHDGRYAVIYGTRAQARDEMVGHFGAAWCEQYSSRERAGVDEFGLLKLARNAWPPRRTVPANDEPDPCPVGDPDCETGDDGSCHDGCIAPAGSEG